jgi:hypothetical protein
VAEPVFDLRGGEKIVENGDFKFLEDDSETGSVDKEEAACFNVDDVGDVVNEGEEIFDGLADSPG